MAGTLEGSLNECIKSLPAVEVGIGGAECEDTSGVEVKVTSARVSVNDKGPVQEAEQLGSLQRSASDSAANLHEDVTDENHESSGLTLDQEQDLYGDSQVQQVLAEVMQGEKKELLTCREHQPQGVCWGCLEFNGTAQELLELFMERDSSARFLPEAWGLVILKHAATHLQMIHAHGLCVEDIGTADIQLISFPLSGRPIALGNLHLACEVFEIPELALPLTTRAKNVFDLGDAATELMGGYCLPEAGKSVPHFSPTTELFGKVLGGDPWGLARPTGPELCALLEEHPLLK